MFSAHDRIPGARGGVVSQRLVCEQRQARDGEGREERPPRGRRKLERP